MTFGMVPKAVLMKKRPSAWCRKPFWGKNDLRHGAESRSGEKMTFGMVPKAVLGKK